MSDEELKRIYKEDFGRDLLILEAGKTYKDESDYWVKILMDVYESFPDLKRTGVLNYDRFIGIKDNRVFTYNIYGHVPINNKEK